jgi:Fic family protein
VNEEIGRRELHPLLVAAVFMAVFLQAKPFAEGNMPTAIFMVMLIMLKSGYDYAPFTGLGALVSDKGDMIYEALRHNQESIELGSPRWERWVGAFMTILQDQKEILYRRLYSRHLPKLSAKIMALFKHHKRLQMGQIVKLTNGRRPTIKLRLGELVEGGYLRRYGAGRSTWYALD